MRSCDIQNSQQERLLGEVLLPEGLRTYIHCCNSNIKWYNTTWYHIGGPKIESIVVHTVDANCWTEDASL